jgi:hypothetical protein
MKPPGWKNQISGIRGQHKIFLHYVGWKVRKYPAVGEVFFLDFPFYRAYQELGTVAYPNAPLNN